MKSQNAMREEQNDVGLVYLGGEIGGVIEFPIAEVREGRGVGVGVGHERAIGMGMGLLVLVVVGGEDHAGELVLIGWPAGDGVGDTATPLEDEGEGGEGEWEHRQKKHDSRITAAAGGGSVSVCTRHVKEKKVGGCM